MTTFAQVRDSRVLAHFRKDITLAEAKAAFRDIAHELYAAPDNVQDGWTFNGTIFAPYTPTADEVRQEAIDAAITGDTVLGNIKGMTAAQYDAWWAANVTNNAQAIGVLKRVVRVLVRRVL